MDLWQKNSEFLRKEYAYLWGEIEKGEEESGISVTSREARDGNPVLYIEKDGREHRLNSPYRPVEEARRWAGQYSFPYPDMICMLFGLGNGLMFQELVKRGREDTSFIVYEPSVEVIRHLMRHSDMEAYLSEENICVAMNEGTMREAVRMCTRKENTPSSVICYHPGYEEIFSEEKVRFLRAIRDGMTLSIATENSLRRARESTVRNLLHFLRHFPEGYLSSSLRALAREGVPAYLVSAGPSLDKNIGWLREAKGHGVILAVDRAMPFLYREGIEPDFLISVDSVANPGWLSARDGSRIPLLTSIGGNCQILDSYPGDIYYFSDIDYGHGLFSDIGLSDESIASGGSVSTNALSLCVNVGFRTVVFVGQDLALGKDGTSHAGGVREDDSQTRYEVEGVDGMPVQTRFDLYQYLLWTEDFIKAHLEVTFLDATEGGALIHGARPVSLRETVEAYGHLKVSCEEVMRQAKRHPSVVELDKFQRRIRKDEEDLAWIERAMARNGETMDRLLSSCEDRSTQTVSHARMLEEASENYQKMLELPVVTFLARYVKVEAQDPIAGVQRMPEDDRENREIIYRKAKDTYKIVQDGARELRGKMRETLEGEGNEDEKMADAR